MNTRLRRCMVSDAPRIYEMCHSELGYTFSEDHVTNNIRRLIGNPQNLLLVAVDQNDEVIGFIHANNHDPIYAPPMKDIVAIVVDPAYRGNGLGTSMLKAVIEWAHDTGAAGVRVNAGIEQKNAGVFYKKLGFDYIHTVYNYRLMLK